MVTAAAHETIGGKDFASESLSTESRDHSRGFYLHTASHTFLEASFYVATILLSCI